MPIAIVLRALLFLLEPDESKRVLDPKKEREERR